jgi:GNAT superfamily N-acetyltransferase
MNLAELFGLTKDWEPIQRASGAQPGFINPVIDWRNKMTRPIKTPQGGDFKEMFRPSDDGDTMEARNRHYSPEEIQAMKDNFPRMAIPQTGGIVRAITPSNFMKATTGGARDLTLDRLPMKMLEKAHRSKEGGVFQGFGKDRGNYVILPGKKGQANELASVFMPQKVRGQGYGKRLIRHATQHNLKHSTKPLDLYAFKDPPKVGMPNLAQIYEKAGFNEVESFPYDPAQNTNLQEWNEAGYGDTDVGRFRYMEQFKKDPATLTPKRPRDESVLLDLKNLGDPSTYPDVLEDPQAQTELYSPSGELSKDLRNVLTPENAERLVTIGQQGVQENMPGWYNTRPIYDEFVQAHGQEEGTKRFLKWADVQKVFSPIASPRNQLQRASFAQYTENQGKDPTTLANAPGGRGKAAFTAHRFPTGLGSLGHKMQLKKLEEVLKGQDLRHGDLKRGQKIMPYGQAMKGGINEFVADRHMKNITTSIDPSLPPQNRIIVKANEFAPLKKFYEEQVMPKLDMPLSQVQESVWGGGKDITGVSGVKGLAEILQELLLENAQSQHLTPQEAKDKYFRDELVLY